MSQFVIKRNDGFAPAATLAGGERDCKCAIIAAVAVCTAAAAAPLRPNDAETTTAIKHVIVIIGENRSFDHIFAAYKPRPGQSVLNLLSEGIIKEDGTPGPNFSKAAQNQAQVTLNYESAPAQKKAYATLPPAMTGRAPQAASEKDPPFRQASMAALDVGIPPSEQHLLLTGATGLPPFSVDTRLPNATMLPNGPYQLTPGIPYDAYTADPVHRFFRCGSRWIAAFVTHLPIIPVVASTICSPGSR